MTSKSIHEIDQFLLNHAMAAVRRNISSCHWSAYGHAIAQDRLDREKHLSKSDGDIDRSLFTGLGALRTDGATILPIRLAPEKVSALRRYLEGLPAHAGYHIFNSDRRPRPLDEVRRDSPYAGYTIDQLLKAPYLLDFLNSPAIIDFVENWIGCVPTLYSINAWWSFPAERPSGVASQFFHRDTDDWRFVVLFIYLTDVDGSAGPHQLIAGSQTIDGMEKLISRARTAGAERLPPNAEGTFRSGDFGAGFSAMCERIIKGSGDSLINIAGPAGTVFVANTVAIHRGLMPTRKPRLIVWARYGLGQNTNSADLETSPLPRDEVAAELVDTPRNRYINRLLVEFEPKRIRGNGRFLIGASHFIRRLGGRSKFRQVDHVATRSK